MSGPATSREQFEAYRRSRIDQRLSDAFSEIMTVRHLNYDFAPWRPFPFSGEFANPRPELELGRRQWAAARQTGAAADRFVKLKVCFPFFDNSKRPVAVTP